MDALTILRLAQKLSGRLTARATIEGRPWGLVDVDATLNAMRNLEAAPCAAFERLAYRLFEKATNLVSTTPVWGVVVIGDLPIGLRRAFLDPTGRSCALDFEAQERVAAALLAAPPMEATSPAPSRICTSCELKAARSLPISEALLRLVVREMMRSGHGTDELDLAARLGLPPLRVLQVLTEAKQQGLVRWNPAH